MSAFIKRIERSQTTKKARASQIQNKQKERNNNNKG
jgi:hypothetical protein